MSSEDKAAHAGYETTDAPPGALWATAVGLAVCVACVFLIVMGFLHFLEKNNLDGERISSVNRVTASVSNTRPQYPEPRLQNAPQLDLAAFKAREEAELDLYGWIDRKKGIVRLPIDKAMDLLVQRGLPYRGQPNAPKATLTPLDMQQARPLQRDATTPAPRGPAEPPQ